MLHFDAERGKAKHTHKKNNHKDATFDLWIVCWNCSHSHFYGIVCITLILMSAINFAVFSFTRRAHTFRPIKKWSRRKGEKHMQRNFIHLNQRPKLKMLFSGWTAPKSFRFLVSAILHIFPIKNRTRCGLCTQVQSQMKVTSLCVSISINSCLLQVILSLVKWKPLLLPKNKVATSFEGTPSQDNEYTQSLPLKHLK